MEFFPDDRVCPQGIHHGHPSGVGIEEAVDQQEGNALFIVGAETGQTGGFGVFTRINEAGQAESFRPLPGQENGQRGRKIRDQRVGMPTDFDLGGVQRIPKRDFAGIALERGSGGNPA